MRVALFGGSFNPPHVGHLLAAAYVRAVAPVDAVWLMPAHKHPFGKQLAPFDDRVALCEALAALVQGVSVTRVESEVPGEGRTLHTVEHLRARYPEHSFRLVVGADIVHEAPKWHAFDQLVRLAPLIVLGRGGVEPPASVPAILGEGCLPLWAVPMPQVSSTEVRARLAAGEDVSRLVPAGVLAELRRRGLYGSLPGSAGG
jgi:nicotinate-nucleotide adenylyltransferase